MDPNTQRAEAERWLGIAVKLLTTRDFLGSKTFAIRAREADPNNGNSDQILAVVDTVLAGERRLSTSQQPDWYAVLQLPRLVRDPELIANHYRRLAMLLSPDHNRLPFADYALQLAMDGWSVLSDPTKKWLFDNDLAMSLQRPDPAQARVDPVRVDHGSAPGGSGGAAGGASAQLNTFQFFQPQPPAPTQQSPPPMWQQQQQQHHQQQSQREFMSPPPPPPMSMSTSSMPPLPFQQAQQLPPQWQIRDPTPAKGRGATVVSTPTSSMAPTPPLQPPQNAQPAPVAAPVTTGWVAPEPARGQAPPLAPEPARGQAPPPAPAVLPPVVPTPSQGRVPYTTVDDGIASNANNVDDGNANSDDNGSDSNTNDGDNGNPPPPPPPAPMPTPAPATGNHCGDEVVEEVDKFWTACPYCLYIYEYKKMYQDCTLRCQNCRRAFHAALIPNPPPIEHGGGDGKDDEEEERRKDSSFCCWGFFPLGFSMAAWKRHNQSVNPNGSSNWVPFSPMFNCPTENGDGNFQWFASGGGGGGETKTRATRKKHVGRQRGLGNDSVPRVYVDDEAYINLSEASDADSSDGDWRNPVKYTKKKVVTKVVNKVVNKGSGTGKRGRPRKVIPGTQNLNRGGGVSVGGENLEDGSEGQVVMGLVAATRSDTRKNVANSLPRKQTRRTVKDMGKLDLNVEFNNEGEDHAPAVRAVNGDEDGIETIGFFEGLDEFLSTLPILNVDGDEKPKPS